MTPQEKHDLLINELIKAPHTIKELSKLTEFHISTVTLWIRWQIYYGIVRCESEYVPNTRIRCARYYYVER